MKTKTYIDPICGMEVDPENAAAMVERAQREAGKNDRKPVVAAAREGEEIVLGG